MSKTNVSRANTATLAAHSAIFSHFQSRHDQRALTRDAKPHPFPTTSRFTLLTVHTVGSKRYRVPLAKIRCTKGRIREFQLYGPNRQNLRRLRLQNVSCLADDARRLRHLNEHRLARAAQAAPSPTCCPAGVTPSDSKTDADWRKSAPLRWLRLAPTVSSGKSNGEGNLKERRVLERRLSL